MPDLPWTTRFIETNGVRLHVAEAGTGFPVILCHGFPELSYSWRHQIPVLAAAGYHVLAPDQRGYGESSRPATVEAYDLDSLAGDLVGLLHAIGEEKAVVIGHDWGSPVVWHAALAYPARVAAVASLSVPYSARASRPPLETMREAAGPDQVFYIDYFQAPGAADAELAADVRASILGFMWSISGDAPREERFRPIPRGGRFIDSITVPSRLPSWLTEADLDVYVDAFQRSGFTGGLNWYRNVDRNWRNSVNLAGAVVQQPAFFITGSRDPARNPAAIEQLERRMPNLRGNHLLPGCGHWTQQERPDDVNRLLLEFLSGAVPT
ncbi:MAG: alpha/beta hydrolase [Chloroflexi bacterium]|nr:alpha/beta hydrolase [Chloroflexota bacterium]